MEEDHETRRKIIRQWMALPKDKRQTEEQVCRRRAKRVSSQLARSEPEISARSLPESDRLAHASC